MLRTVRHALVASYAVLHLTVGFQLTVIFYQKSATCPSEIGRMVQPRLPRGGQDGYYQQPLRCLVRWCHTSLSSRSMGWRRIPQHTLPHGRTGTRKSYSASHLRMVYSVVAQRQALLQILSKVRRAERRVRPTLLELRQHILPRTLRGRG